MRPRTMLALAACGLLAGHLLAGEGTGASQASSGQASGGQASGSRSRAGGRQAEVRRPLPRPAPRRFPWSPRFEVAVHRVPGGRATVDVEIRNASDEDLDIPITATLTLRPLAPPDGSEPPMSAWLSADLDPLTGVALDAAGTETALKLPVRGSRRVRVRLETLGWSLSPPLYVWVPRPLSQVADYPEYELTFGVRARGPFPESATSEPVRIRLPQP